MIQLCKLKSLDHYIYIYIFYDTHTKNNTKRTQLRNLRHHLRISSLGPEECHRKKEKSGGSTHPPQECSSHSHQIKHKAEREQIYILSHLMHKPQGLGSTSVVAIDDAKDKLPHIRNIKTFDELQV